MNITIYAHSRDCSSVNIFDENDNMLFDHGGYFPYIGHLCEGDDLEITIDNETGKILGWVPLTEEDIQRLKEEVNEFK